VTGKQSGGRPLRRLTNPDPKGMSVFYCQMRSKLLLLVVLARMMLHGQPPEPKEPYRVGGSVSAPKVVYKVEPQYTEEALRSRREGTVRVLLVVTRDGMPSDVHELEQHIGLGLDEKAIEAVQQWRFEPGKKNAEPVAVQVQIEMNFRLPRQ
jgi:TonB family protein